MPPRPAVVSIFADGSVMVTTAGAELGQGMFTKVKQARLCTRHPSSPQFLLGWKAWKSSWSDLFCSSYKLQLVSQYRWLSCRW